VAGGYFRKLGFRSGLNGVRAGRVKVISLGSGLLCPFAVPAVAPVGDRLGRPCSALRLGSYSPAVGWPARVLPECKPVIHFGNHSNGEGMNRRSYRFDRRAPHSILISTAEVRSDSQSDPSLAWNSATSWPFATLVDNDTLLVQAGTHQSPVARLLNIQCLGQCCVISSEKRIDHTGRGSVFGCWKARRIARLCRRGFCALGTYLLRGWSLTHRKSTSRDRLFATKHWAEEFTLLSVSPGITSTGTCTCSSPVRAANLDKCLCIKSLIG
jgi:hypothetical protein